MKKQIALVSSILMLCTCTAGLLPVQAASHTLEPPRTEEWYAQYLKQAKDQWFLGMDGVIYCSETGIGCIMEDYVPNAGTCDRSELLRALMHQYPDGQFAVLIWTYSWEEYEKEAEESYLRENGIAFTSIKNAGKYAVLTADQLENFPVYEKAGYLIGLAKVEDSRYQIEDGVIYRSEIDNVMEFEPLDPPVGTCQYSDVLQTLMHQYPDGRFAVLLSSCSAAVSEEEAKEAHIQEEKYLLENGIKFTQIGSDDAWYQTKYAVLTADQLENFPVYEKVGYQISLAKKSDMVTPTEPEPTTDPVPTVYGDVNEDGVIDILDVIRMNKFLLGSATFTDAQKAAGDINRDGKLDSTDSLGILKQVVGLDDDAK